MKIFLFISMLLLTACKSEGPDMDALVLQYYTERQFDLKKERFEICQDEIRSEAKSSIDSLSFPARPRKPIKPEAIIDKFEKFSLDTLVQKKDSL
jgi:hypothetical protein